MPSCKKCCRKFFPNGCCGFCKPPPQVQQQLDIKAHVKEATSNTSTPYGFINIYPGVRTSDNTYTCPMLSVHLYRHSKFKADIAGKNRIQTVDTKNQVQTYEHSQQSINEEKITGEEEIIMLPLEDVILISSKAEIEKGLQADVKAETTPEYALSENCCDRCCAKVLSCCRKTRDCCCYLCKDENKIGVVLKTTTTIYAEDPNREVRYKEEYLPVPEVKEGCCTNCGNRFRCWCCRKKKLVNLIRRTKIVEETQAKRVITITIEYNKYSNLDTPTHTRLLGVEQQLAYYNKKFNSDTKLSFYLVHNAEFDPKNYELKRKQAEILCRTVMQLKGMKDHYPSENELDKIVDQSQKRTFGDVFDEPVLQLPLNPTATIRDSQMPGLPQPPKSPTLSQKRITTSE